MSGHIPLEGTPLYSAENSYDKLGRLTEQVELAGGQTAELAYQYSAAGFLTAVARGDGSTSYTYDSNGTKKVTATEIVSSSARGGRPR